MLIIDALNAAFHRYMRDHLLLKKYKWSNSVRLLERNSTNFMMTKYRTLKLEKLTWSTRILRSICSMLSEDWILDRSTQPTVATKWSSTVNLKLSVLKINRHLLHSSHWSFTYICQKQRSQPQSTRSQSLTQQAFTVFLAIPSTVSAPFQPKKDWVPRSGGLLYMQ